MTRLDYPAQEAALSNDERTRREEETEWQIQKMNAAK